MLPAEVKSRLEGFVSNFRTIKSQRRVGFRFVMMSEDLTALRWSWEDYILIHEIRKRPTAFVDPRSPDKRGSRSSTRTRRAPTRACASR